ncbi:ATP-binding protein [Streptosporangium sp. NPDC006007]|uniref:ATP-binding protein n=1 Tax=Streptosporangium sp. NPDC006007 TaxID=3154575 RepID=UPI0033A9A4B6
MTGTPDWEKANNTYLTASLAWLTSRLDALTPRHPDPGEGSVPDRTSAPDRPPAEPPRRGETGERRARDHSAGPPPADGADIGELEVAREAAAEVGEGTAPPALVQVAGRLGLSDFERDVLLLCVAPAIEPRVGGLIAAAQGDPGATAPTFALALRLFDDARWDALSPERGLRFWRLVEPVGAGARPLVTVPLRADDRIVDLVRGLNRLDERLAELVEHRPDPAAGLDLPPSSRAVADALVGAALTETPDGRFPVIQLLGGDEQSRELVAVRAMARFNRDLYHLPVDALAGAGADVDLVARLWQRDSLLLPNALLLDATDADPGGAVVQRFLSHVGGLVLLATREVWPITGRATSVIDVTRPSPAEQAEVWAVATGLALEGAPRALAGQFRLSVPAIHRIATALRPTLGPRPAEEAGVADGEGPERLWAACRASARPRLEALAQRTVPRAEWDELVLPEEQTSLLRQLVAHVRHQATVFSTWGFGERGTRGNGVTALFSGPSGTGKTFATEVLARELGLDLYRVDLSAVVNKYIGETEKNLRRVFDAAEDGGALLLFDEADALFGRRSEVRDSHDRYANIEVSYLLQRMEAYEGVAVLATNLRAALDPAFLRRLRFVVDFPLPAHAERRRLWSAAFPPAAPLGELDLDALVELPVTGAAVQAIALGAAFLAAGDGEPIGTRTVLRAARMEFRKLGLPLTVPNGERVRR